MPYPMYFREEAGTEKDLVPCHMRQPEQTENGGVL